ncbi:hypothetical protein BGZ74_010562 [Mortierella antarctica]|nr:hypothetical protein BGZ74_010562 [Mortierella antarctica]
MGFNGVRYKRGLAFNHIFVNNNNNNTNNSSRQLLLSSTMALNNVSTYFLAVVWCGCSNNASKTQQFRSFAAGNFDGSSCGLDPVAKLDSVIYRCQSISGKVNCWAEQNIKMQSPLKDGGNS